MAWYNLESEALYSWSPAAGSGGGPTDLAIPPGLYGFDQLAALIDNIAATLSVDRANGLILFNVASDYEVRLSDNLLSLLGLHDGLGGDWLTEGVFIGDRPVNLSRTKVLRVHLEELNTTANYVDGTPSTLLATVGLGNIAFGDIENVRVEHPEFKRLRDGALTELTVRVLDDKGRRLNTDLPICATLEFL